MKTRDFCAPLVQLDPGRLLATENGVSWCRLAVAAVMLESIPFILASDPLPSVFDRLEPEVGEKGPGAGERASARPSSLEMEGIERRASSIGGNGGGCGGQRWCPLKICMSIEASLWTTVTVRGLPDKTGGKRRDQLAMLT